MKTEVFENQIGKMFYFYGVNCNCFKLDEKVWEALEDPNDGYRSFMDSVVLNFDNLVFPRQSLTRVKVLVDEDLDGFQLVDEKDGHVWLRFGTDETDCYYPFFAFEYQPKQS